MQKLTMLLIALFAFTLTLDCFAQSTTFLQVQNRAASTLDGDINSGVTSLDVDTGGGVNFPSSFPYHITIDSEILNVTGRSTDTFTVTRGAESTTPSSHLNGAAVRMHITAQTISDLNDAVNNIEDGTTTLATVTTTGVATIGTDIAVNGGDVTTDDATGNLFNATPTTVNLAGAGTTVSVGAGSGTTTVNNNLTVAIDAAINGGDITSDDATATLFNTTPTTVNIGGAADVNIGGAAKTITVAGDLVADKDLAVDGGDVTTDDATGNLFNATPTTVNVAGAGTTVSIGAGSGTTTINNSADVTDALVVGTTVTLQNGQWLRWDNAAASPTNIMRTDSSNDVRIRPAAINRSIIFQDSGNNAMMTITDAGTVGDLVVTGDISSANVFESAFSGLVFNRTTSASTTTTISTQDVWTKFIYNVVGGELQEEDLNSNVTGSKANSEITANAGGTGSFELSFAVNFSIAAGVNQDVLWGIAQDLATPLSISSSTDATPVVVTTGTAHGLKDGDSVIISGHATNTVVNGSHLIDVASSTTFALRDFDGGAVAGSGGGAGSGGAVDTHIHSQFIAYRQIASSSSVGSASGTGIEGLGSGDTVYLVGLNHDSTQNLTTSQCSLSVIRLSE